LPIPDPPADVPREVIRQVVARDRCCRLCGRPNGLDAWRHSEPGVAGDGPGNFTALCSGCITATLGTGIRPTRYIVHVSEPALAWRRLQVWIAEGLTVAVGGVYAAFVVFLVWAVERLPVTQWGLVADAAIFFGMVLLLAVLVRGLLDRWRWRASAQAMERTLEAEVRR
jgi:hypothetical protein